MDYRPYIRIQENFPKPGISFKDVSPLLADPKAFQAAIEEMAAFASQYSPDLIVGPDSRGFLFGTPLAYRMKLPFAMARKIGKLPGETLKESYDLEYGHSAVEMPKFVLKPGMRVVLVDDLLATGGTIQALERIVERAGAKVVAVITMIELKDLHGRDKIIAPFRPLIQYDC